MQRSIYHTFLVDAEHVIAAFGSLRRQTWIDIVEAKVYERRPAWYDVSSGVDEGMTQNGYTLHAEF